MEFGRPLIGHTAWLQRSETTKLSKLNNFYVIFLATMAILCVGAMWARSTAAIMMVISGDGIHLFV